MVNSKYYKLTNNTLNLSQGVKYLGSQPMIAGLFLTLGYQEFRAIIFDAEFLLYMGIALLRYIYSAEQLSRDITWLAYLLVLCSGNKLILDWFCHFNKVCTKTSDPYY